MHLNRNFITVLAQVKTKQQKSPTVFSFVPTLSELPIDLFINETSLLPTKIFSPVSGEQRPPSGAHLLKITVVEVAEVGSNGNKCYH